MDKPELRICLFNKTAKDYLKEHFSWQINVILTKSLGDRCLVFQSIGYND